MKTNAMTKTKEEELSEWILEVMNYMGFDTKFYSWVAMDEDREVFCFKSKPDLSKCGAYWVYSVQEPFVSLGYLPDHLCIHPWHEFLLRWVDVPKRERSLLVGHTTRINEEGRAVIVEHYDDGFTREIDYANECAKVALRALTPDTCLVRHSLGEGGSPTPDLAPGRMERAVQVLRRLTTEPSPPPPAAGSLTPAFQREVWAADVMSEAYRITVAIVEEPLPSPQEVPHWRLPTDEELDRLLPGGWTERCPLDL